MKHLFCLGFGFTAENLAKILPRDQWRISGTTRSLAGVSHMGEQNVQGYIYDELDSLPSDVTHVLASIPPGENGDTSCLKFMTKTRSFEWIGYLSTTGVYGDHSGGWVDEDTPVNPTSARAKKRALAEQQWLLHGAHIFRLPGIYGPGRSQLDALRAGTAKRVIKSGQFFSRIHVEDIAGILAASIGKPDPSRIYNVADDVPCPPEDVVTFAAQLLRLDPPPLVKFEDAQLSPMARSFYDESKRVSNGRIKTELGYVLKYPNFRQGLTAIHQASGAT